VTALLATLFGTATLYTAVTSRLGAMVNVLALQGFILFFIVLLRTPHLDGATALFLLTETLLFKSVLIPRFLLKTIRLNEIHREVEPNIPHFHSLLLASGILAMGFALAFWSSENVPGVLPIQYGIALSTIATGLMTIITRRKIITHVMGYMIMQNGIFLLSLSISREMPLLVNLGILLDLFSCIFLLSLFFGKVKTTFGEADTAHLETLRD
jgi:hydrogenase-4 component E